MPTYVMLTNLTAEGVRTLKNNPGRVAEVNKEVEQIGAKVWRSTRRSASTTSSPWSNPRARQSATTALPSMSNSIACNKPKPRTSFTRRCRSLRAANPFAKLSPARRLFSRIFPCRSTRSTARPAAQAKGLPPNVDA